MAAAAAALRGLLGVEDIITCGSGSVAPPPDSWLDACETREAEPIVGAPAVGDAGVDLGALVGAFEGTLRVEDPREHASIGMGIEPVAWYRATSLDDAWRADVRVSLQSEPWLAESGLTGTLCVLNGEARLDLDRTAVDRLKGTIEPPWGSTSATSQLRMIAERTSGAYEGSVELLHAYGDDAPFEWHLWGTLDVARAARSATRVPWAGRARTVSPVDVGGSRCHRVGCVGARLRT